MAKKRLDYKAASKINWYSDVEEHETDWPGMENVKMACLQRIAAATEAMAVNHIQLQADYERAKNGRENYLKMYEESQRRIIALKGVITKLKKKHHPPQQ